MPAGIGRVEEKRKSKLGQLKFGYKWSSPNVVEVRYVVLCCKVNSTLQIEDCQYTPARYLNCRYMDGWIGGFLQ